MNTTKKKKFNAAAMKIDQDNVYWLFSTTSQTISSFIAFLLTGFALVLSMMDSLQQRDESLIEIHEQMKQNYYRRMLVLSFVSGLSIVFSLGMLYVNGFQWEYKPLLFILSFFLSILAIVFAIFFVLAIVNPNRYTIAAKDILKEESEEFSITGSEVMQVNFMHEYIDLEKKLRDILKNNNLITDVKAIIPFRQIVSLLYESELITQDMLYELLQINKYRNLVVHGHLNKVDEGMVQRVKKVVDELQVNELLNRK